MLQYKVIDIPKVFIVRVANVGTDEVLKANPDGIDRLRGAETIFASRVCVAAMRIGGGRPVGGPRIAPVGLTRGRRVSRVGAGRRRRFWSLGFGFLGQL